eukprot:4830773-Amphidinium_carterae.1
MACPLQRQEQQQQSADDPLIAWDDLFPEVIGVQHQNNGGTVVKCSRCKAFRLVSPSSLSFSVPTPNT